MIRLLHANKKFSHQVVPTSGHAYRNCEFLCCEIHIRELPDKDTFGACKATDCVFRLDMVINDRTEWRRFLRLDNGAPAGNSSLYDMIAASLPQIPLDDRLPGLVEVTSPEDLS